MWEIVDGHKYGKFDDINPDDYVYLERHVGGGTFYERIKKEKNMGTTDTID